MFRDRFISMQHRALIEPHAVATCVLTHRRVTSCRSSPLTSDGLSTVPRRPGARRKNTRSIRTKNSTGPIERVPLPVPGRRIFTPLYLHVGFGAR